MQRYFVQIAYRGTAYHGWQSQPNAPSVQETIERCFSKLFGNTSVPIVGCGRTDAGVHAKSYYFHVDLPQEWEEEQLCFKLNRMLPRMSVPFGHIEFQRNFMHALMQRYVPIAISFINRKIHFNRIKVGIFRSN